VALGSIASAGIMSVNSCKEKYFEEEDDPKNPKPKTSDEDECQYTPISCAVGCPDIKLHGCSLVHLGGLGA